MGKYLLLLALAVWGLWLWRKSGRAATDRLKPPEQRPSERMLSCRHCGVHQPESEGLWVGSHYYCCSAHQTLAESANRANPTNSTNSTSSNNSNNSAD
ncbi:MAG: PP0621 family protein [Pseudomonadota bacterium]